MEFREKLVYGTAAGTADMAMTAAGKPTILPVYGSMAAAVLALNANGLCASSISFEDPLCSGRPIRCNLSMGMVGAAGVVTEEDWYLVTPTGMDDKQGVRLEKYGTAVFTASAVAIPADQGGRTNHVWPSAVAVAGTGLATSRGSVEPVAGPSQTPAFATVFDVANAIGLIRVSVKNAVSPPTGFAPLAERWR